MKTSFKQSVLGTAVTLALVACGGGGSSSDSAAPGAAATSLKLTGTAATGQAIGNAPVEAKCSVGAGAGTTRADGSFTIELTGASLPCVIEVRPTTGAALHAVVEGSGAGNVTVNVTPLTELVAARTSGGAPADLFTTFDAAGQGKVNAAAVNAAIASIVTALQGVVDLTGVNPMHDPLVAANGSAAGNPHDQKLDALKAALAAAQTTLAELTTAVVVDTGSHAPVRTMLQPAAASCAGLRSGKYRILSPHQVGVEPSYVAYVATLDAATLKASADHDSTHTTDTFTPDAASPCKFTSASTSGATTVLLSKSGLGVVLTPASTGPLRTSIILPEQSLPLTELAGTWNYLGFTRGATAAAFAQGSGTTVIDAAGNITGGSECTGLDTCKAYTGALGNFTVNAAGGFDIGTGRAFALKTATGKVSLFIIDRDTGGITVSTKQAAMSLPVVGAVSKVWDFAVLSNGTATTPTDFTSTIKSVDAAAQSYTRQRLSDGRIDSFTINQPRDGMRHRPAGTSLTTTGASVSISELLMMSLPDTGLTVYTGVASTLQLFGVSLARPDPI